MSVGKPLTVTEQSLRLKNALQVKPIVATVMVEEMDIRCDCDFVTRSKLFTTITTTTTTQSLYPARLCQYYRSMGRYSRISIRLER